MIVEPHQHPGDPWTSAEAVTGDVDLHGSVQVWRVDLDRAVVRESLSPDERSRAAALKHSTDRRRFIVGRSVLRAILAGAIGQGGDPGRLRFVYGPTGKPFLGDDAGLHFNVSHSEAIALIAVTRAGAIGIDVERTRPLDDWDGVARLAFDDSERADLASARPADRIEVFYRLWTCKEALLKAMGIGLAAVDTEQRSLADGAKRRFAVSVLEGIPHFAAALARPIGTTRVRLQSWPDSAVW